MGVNVLLPISSMALLLGHLIKWLLYHTCWRQSFLFRVAKKLRVPPVRKVYHVWGHWGRFQLLVNRSQQISAKSAETRNKKPIFNVIIYIFCNLNALNRIILRKIWKLEILHGGRLNTFCNSVSFDVILMSFWCYFILSFCWSQNVLGTSCPTVARYFLHLWPKSVYKSVKQNLKSLLGWNSPCFISYLVPYSGYIQ